MKRIFSGVVTAALVVLLALADVAGSFNSLPTAAAAEAPSITLSGSVDKDDAGFIDPKSVILSSGEERRVTYRLVPGYSSGAATDVRVSIYLPSLLHVDGEYQVVGRDAPPTPMGVQGRVSAGGGWNVLSDTTVQGGPIVMQYDGDLGAGGNPAFDIFLKTYNDQSDGVYGGVPEGTSFELNGFVSYEMFNRVPGSKWETPKQLDDESRVSVISSDLTWEAKMESYVPDGASDVVPIWDRYQYIDYMYSLENTSDNIASNIDGYSVSFGIDSTDSEVNGIIPFDINRWQYNDGAPPTANDPSNTSGEFIGVPGQGGVLIYDVTEWDGLSELTDEIPYTYSGGGMISIDRENGANKQGIKPAPTGEVSERKYLVSLPLSRQGFPNPPTFFKVKVITNVLFAKTANWSKTSTVEREITVPTYEFSFEHNTKQNDVVYGYETYNEIANIRSNSNAPTFNSTIDYLVDEDFILDRVTYEVPEEHLASFEDAGVRYTYIDEKTGDPVSETLTALTQERDDATGVITLTFDVSHLKNLDWDQKLNFSLADRVEAHTTLPVNIKVFGAPYRVGPMTATATAIFVEKIASNDDFGENTTYTEVPHETVLDATFNVIYPEEVVPEILVSIDGKGDKATVKYEEESVIDFFFGVNDTIAERSTTTLTLNEADEVLAQVELTLKAALFEQAKNVRVSYETLSGTVKSIDLGAHTSGDFTVSLPKGAAKVVIETDALESSGAVNFASVTAKVGHKLTKQHIVTGEILTYQPKPYDKETTRDATGTIEIQLPNELKPVVDVVGVYGSLKTKTTTHVGYESTFDVEYQLDTLGVNSPSSEYVIDALKPTKKGELVFGKITLQDAYLDSITDAVITFVDAAGNEQAFDASALTLGAVTTDEVTLDDIAKIVISGKNLALTGLTTIAVVEYDADIEIGSSQDVRATFTGTQEQPFDDEKSATQKNQITVRETQTKVQVEGVNQVTDAREAGTDYSVSIYKWWNRGYTYNTQDYTLDQGYKSLGGFTSTLTRPTATFDNNDQHVNVSVDLPYEHFDMYYLKIREDMQEYIDTVDIYRMVDGEEVLWKQVPGSEWTANSQDGKGSWRIGTARPDIDDQRIFDTPSAGIAEAEHAFYKEAWDADVRPESPVSRVEINLEFTRENNDAIPQMSGVNDDIVEYMGRFHSTSVDGKKKTKLTALDTFGVDTKLERTHSHDVNSLVAYPFAQSSTGAHDNTTLKNKIITMGNVGEYLASILNKNTASWPYYNGHGPDVYSPAATEYDEWLGKYDPASFHDELVYEFVYPASPKNDAVYNLEPKHVVIAGTSTLQYLTGVRALDDQGNWVSIEFDVPLTEAPRFDYDNSVAAGIYDDGDGTFTVSFGEDRRYPKKFEAIFEEVEGFGDKTAEIAGVKEQTLGASIGEVDVRVGGVVNGNKALLGTSNLYRIPADTGKKELMHSSSATLTGYTPKLGAQLGMTFDRVKVYDYGVDGTTPNTTKATLSLKNSAEADVKDVNINFTPDANFRSQLIEIPEDIFAGDWSVASVKVTQGKKTVEIPLDQFVANAQTGNREFDLLTLFADETFKTEPYSVTLGGPATLLKKQIDNIAVAFVPKDDSVRLWGSLQVAENPAANLPLWMRGNPASGAAYAGDLFVTGVWVDEDDSGSNWDSKPSFVGESTKASNERITSYTSFNVAAQVTSYNPIFVSEGTGNRGEKPTLTHSSNANSAVAPRLYNRVAQLQSSAVHLEQNFASAQAPRLFYDADTGTQIDAGNIAVGDTVKVLYKLNNRGTTNADDHGPSALPIFRPIAHVEAPAFLEISSIEATTEFFKADANREQLTLDGKAVDAAQVHIDERNSKRADIKFDLTLGDNESVYFYVEYTATSDGNADLSITQNKSLQWNVYSRPDYAHHYMSYDSVGTTEQAVLGGSVKINVDGDAVVEDLGRLQNTLYRYTNPNQLRIESKFDGENVSGKEMTLTVKNIRNETTHDNTRLDLFLTLNKNLPLGFELTEFPEPKYPDGYVGTLAEPQVYFLHGTDWVNKAQFDSKLHKMAEINQLWVDYGTVPAAFQANDFAIKGIGHWKTSGAKNTKSWVITSVAESTLTHQEDQGQGVAEYKQRNEASSTAWKAIPSVEFNLQSFATIDEARADYNGAAVGKTSYLPGDTIHYRLTAKNHDNFKNTHTSTAYGTAPLKKPVIIDRIPEYVTTALLGHQKDGVLDVAAAIAAGDLEIRVRQADGQERAITLPEATVKTVTGLDIGGAQEFANDRPNDGWGRLSSAHPSDIAKNPAAKTEFSVIEYSFGKEDLGRGEQLEIIYTATARTADPDHPNNLPVATYKSGEAVFAPFFGWYKENTPVASTAKNVSMDMATLLHDAGISGDRGHEMTAEEFLSNSHAWQLGVNDKRREGVSQYYWKGQDTYYDESANTQKSHPAYLRETANNDLYTTFTSTAVLDDNFNYVGRARLSNDEVPSAAREDRVMWAQDGLQLSRAWLYGASEMVPDVERSYLRPVTSPENPLGFPEDPSNYYEHDGSLNYDNQYLYQYSPYVKDDYTYAVQLHEQFTVRLHAANLGDRTIGDSALGGGLEYTEILPLGISPFDEEGNLLGITAFDGAGTELASTYEIVQTPEDDKGLRAPAQSQEAGTYQADSRIDGVPYVVKVQVATPVTGLFDSVGIDRASEKQRVDIRVRVFEELPPAVDFVDSPTAAEEVSYWHDEFTLTTITPEEFLEIYSDHYGAFNKDIDWYNRAKFPNDGMSAGLEVNDLMYAAANGWVAYFAVEPWGKYVRGLNAQAVETTADAGKPALVTGDRIAMRKPTLRVWSSAAKDSYNADFEQSMQDFSVDLYEEFTINSTVENQQLEVTPEYNRIRPGYNYNSYDNLNDDIWINAPQTIGGARGSWFEPTVTIALPYGIVPVLSDGPDAQKYARYYDDIASMQDALFTATVNDITYNTSTTTPEQDVSEHFDVKVELIEDELGKRFVMHFTAKGERAADIAYGQSLVISPRVVTIDTPMFGDDSTDERYAEVLTFAGTKRPVFNPIVSDRYVTGAAPSLTARDKAASVNAPHNVKSWNGKSISVNDSERRDSTSTWHDKNMGALKITEPLISPTKRYADATEVVLSNNGEWLDTGATFTPAEPADAAWPTSKHGKSGAYGGTFLNLKKPGLTNSTKAANYADSAEQDLVQVDAAGKYWYVTEVTNESADSRIAPVSQNPYEQLKVTGAVHNSRFVITQFVTNFAEATGEVRIKLSDPLLGDQVLDRAEFEALGYSIERLIPQTLEADEHRNRIQWVVTTPANDRGTFGQLKSGESFKMLYEVQLVEGYEDEATSADDVWRAPELVADSYVSLVSDDKTLIPAGTPGAQREEDFIVQSLESMTYRTHAADKAILPDVDFDIDGNGDLAGLYAADTVEVEIRKPKAEVRINTTRPRIAYSNGLSGDTYFNSADTIEYLITHAEITGSGLNELVIENIVPTHEKNDDSVSLSNQDVSTSVRYVTSGIWAFPEETLARLEAAGKTVDDAFKTFIYVSDELAENGYERDNWTLLNGAAGTSTTTNESFNIPADTRKVRIVVKATDEDNYLVPKGTRLDIDADPLTDGRQSVLETDPDNHSTSQFPTSVTDSAIAMGLKAFSTAKSTLFIYGTAQIWGNYVGSSVTKLDQSETRSYLTPSRPVVNVKYDSLYYRSDGTKPENQKYGWSDVTAIAPKSSPHLKFKGEYINADKSMWSRDEDNTYAEDTLIDPFITFQLPSVMEGGGDFTYVPADKVTPDHPLNSEHRSQYSLTSKENNLWTWKLLRADGSVASDESKLKHVDMYAGPWAGVDRNVVSVWFEGIVSPGDKIVVEFIGSVDAYSPGTDAEDLKSRTLITNSTGMLQPLNSRQNSANHLGYTTDINDLNRDQMSNDRLVFAERTMFQYEVYDDFGKRKSSNSDLNRAGTVAPEITPVRQGGDFSFEVSVDNSRESGDRAYPYPIIYDVLPSLGDTSIIDATKPRDSKYSAWLLPESIQLKREGANKKTYAPSEYTVFVGPFTKRDGKVVVSNDRVSHEDAAKDAFYESMGLPGKPSAARDKSFVPLAEIKNDPALLHQVENLLVLFTNPAETLPGQNKLKLTYDMKAPLNAPAYMEQFDAPEKKAESALWNSFMATQRGNQFVPQESNNAGVFVTEQKDNVYIGNYVWNDVNYNGAQDEGESFVDQNGRTHLRPSKDLNFDGVIDDPGINGVTVTLLTENGYNVDALGNPIHQVGAAWEVVDEVTGKSVLDEVFLLPIVSEGPLVTQTESDFYGNAGYYTFSNIKPGNYRVMYEFSPAHDRFSATTQTVFDGTKVQAYAPGDVLGIPAAVNNAALVAITDPALVDAKSLDEARMSFDLGVAQKIKVGGTIFNEELDTLDGYQAGPNEVGIPDYVVYLKRMNGDTVLDAYGKPMVATTDALGKYSFDLLPVDRKYYVQVAASEITADNDGFSTERLVSPFVHNADPFTENLDNDGLNEKGTRVVKTNALNFSLSGLFKSQFAERDSVSVGFYDKSSFGVIGNRVWDDLNRDGVQDAIEPGIAGQELHLEQYIQVGDEWTKTGFTQSTTSNADGYYYFTKVPSTLYDGANVIPTKYQVVVSNLVTGYTFALTNQAAAANAAANEVDSDFFKNGTLHESAAVGDHLISVFETDEQSGIDFGVTDNTVDLGLVKHALSSFAGEVFIDTDRDGVQNDAEPADERYTATLEVRAGADWVEAKQDANGRMIEPALAQGADATMQQIGVNAYRFENLHIIDNQALVPYEYRVKMTSIPLWQEVTKLQVGNDAAVDNDFSQEARALYNTAVSDTRILGELQQDLLLPIETFTGVAAEQVDLGLFGLPTQATIGDFIWSDLNGDGVQNAKEPGIEGLRVVLNRVVDGVLVPVDETLTDASGAYEFTADVAEGDSANPRFNQPHVYVVEFDRTSRQTLSPFKVGSDDTKNSKFENLVSGGAARYGHSIADPAHAAVSAEFTLVGEDLNGYAAYDTAASTDRIDGGMVAHESIRVLGDTVYHDVDADGVQDPAEPGIAGLQVSLFKLNRTTGLWEAHEDTDGRSAAKTNAKGEYEFAVEVADLDKQSPHYRTAEEYRVLVEAPANMRLVEINNVFFYQASNLVDGIPIPRPYSSVLTEAITLIDSDAEGVVLSSARDVLTADAGFSIYETSVIIGGVVWEDVEFNGVQDDAEAGIADRTVTLWELVDGVWTAVEDLQGLGSVVTDADGYYEFEVSPTYYDETAAKFLAPREYRVTTDRAGFELWSPLNVGDDRAIDSDISAAGPEFGSVLTGVTHVFSIADLVAGGDIVDVATVRNDVEMDAGLKTHADRVVIGGVVWEDAEFDGLQGDAEVGIAGRTVTLWELVDGVWAQVEDLDGRGSVVTDADGYYEFVVSPTHYDPAAANYLAPREYRVTTDRAGFELWSPLNVGDDRAIDSDISAVDLDVEPDLGSVLTGVTHVFSIADLVAGGDIVDVSTVRDDVQMDVGLKTHADRVVIGGVVWNDLDEDGAQQAREPVIADQRVTLWEQTADGWEIVEDLLGNSTQVTDADGFYEFEVQPTNYDETADDFLLPREYRTTVETPSGYKLSSGNQTVTLEGQTVLSQLAVIVTLQDDGSIDVTTLQDDLTLSFPFVKIPVDLSITGSNVKYGYVALLILLGLGIVIVGVRRQRAKNAQ